MNKKLPITVKLLFLFVFAMISWNTTQNDPFIFQKENQKVILEIENGTKSLKWNEKAKLTFKLENIDLKKLSFSAPGLRRSEVANNSHESLWEITPDKKYIKTDTLKLFVIGRDVKDSVWKHTFRILIK